MDDEHHDTTQPRTARQQPVTRGLLRLMGDDDRPIAVALCLIGLITLPFTAFGGGLMAAMGVWMLVTDWLKYEEPRLRD